MRNIDCAMFLKMPSEPQEFSDSRSVTFISQLQPERPQLTNLHSRSGPNLTQIYNRIPSYYRLVVGFLTGWKSPS